MKRPRLFLALAVLLVINGFLLVPKAPAPPVREWCYFEPGGRGSCIEMCYEPCYTCTCGGACVDRCTKK